jgi:hypothetical protein
MVLEPSPWILTPRRNLLVVCTCAIVVIAAVSLAGCSSRAPDTIPTAADSGESPPSTTAPPPASATATATVGPGRATGFFSGSLPEVPVTFMMPAGWESNGPFVNKSGADPVFGLVFMDVGNIYSDGCSWELVNPPPGPTVDDLVAAYAEVPGVTGPARDVTVSGFPGKQIEFTVPDYNEDECTDGRFGIFKHDQSPGNDPALWAQAPNQLNTLRILDVHGTRLVILTGDPGNLTAQDRTDVDRILRSIRIG